MDYYSRRILAWRLARMRDPRLTRGGAPCDNAHMESCFHLLKADLIHGRRFPTADALRTQRRHYLRFYNHERLHSSLGYRSPVDYERQTV